MVTTFTHFCCQGCYDKVFSAVRQLDWIASAAVDKDSLPPQSANQLEEIDPRDDAASKYNKDAIFYIKEKEIPYLNLLRAEQKFRESGLVSKRVVLKNIPEFELIAVDPHLCCGLCASGAKQVLDIEVNRQKALAAKNGFNEENALTSPYNLREYTIDKAKQEIRATFREQADISAFLMAIEKAGFAPTALKIVPKTKGS